MNRCRIFVNALTFSRVPLIFAWMALALHQEFSGGFVLGFWACVALTLSALTDLVDGHLARKWGVVSTLGKMADPLMDKVFYVVTFPTVAWLAVHQGERAHAIVLLSFAVLYMLRDLWVTFLRSVGTMFGADVGAMWLGKVRTALSFPCAGWIYLYLFFLRTTAAADAWRWSCYVFEVLMIGLTLVSVFTYTYAYAPYLHKALAQK